MIPSRRDLFPAVHPSPARAAKRTLSTYVTRLSGSSAKQDRAGRSGIDLASVKFPGINPTRAHLSLGTTARKVGRSPVSRSFTIGKGQFNHEKAPGSGANRWFVRPRLWRHDDLGAE